MRIFTDASTSGRVSGVAYVATDCRHNVLSTNSKAFIESDNNTAELMAVLFALEELSPITEHTTIITDSQYVIGVLKTDVCRKFEEPVWSRIKQILYTAPHSVLWIKGHKNDGTSLSAFNRQADRSAKNARKAFIIRRRREKVMKNKLLHREKGETRE